MSAVETSTIVNAAVAAVKEGIQKDGLTAKQAVQTLFGFSIGAMYAAGMSPDEISEMAKEAATAMSTSLPPKPKAKFSVGDIIAEKRDGLRTERESKPRTKFTVTEVITEWIIDKWIESITFENEDGSGIGSPDLFELFV